MGGAKFIRFFLWGIVAALALVAVSIQRSMHQLTIFSTELLSQSEVGIRRNHHHHNQMPGASSLSSAPHLKSTPSGQARPPRQIHQQVKQREPAKVVRRDRWSPLLAERVAEMSKPGGERGIAHVTSTKPTTSNTTTAGKVKDIVNKKRVSSLLLDSIRENMSKTSRRIFNRTIFNRTIFNRTAATWQASRRPWPSLVHTRPLSDFVTTTIGMADRPVGMLTYKNMTIFFAEFYSGMWWTSRERFLMVNYTPFKRLESASFNLFARTYWRVRATTDWLDLSVEHLSKFYKLIQQYREGPVYDRFVSILHEYIANRSLAPFPTSALSPAHRTIAAIPFTSINVRTDRERTKYDHERDKYMLALEMACTLTSLWRVGIGRAVVAGLNPEDGQITQEAFAIIHDKLQVRPMELAFIQVPDPSLLDMQFLPRRLLRDLQTAFRGGFNEAEQKQWLGQDPARWQFIYFTEPDLLLLTRPHALQAFLPLLSKNLVLSAHRLEPIPLQRDFQGLLGYRHALPDLSNFSVTDQLHSLQGDACCDAGQHYPANLDNSSIPGQFRGSRECYSIWAYCGFGRPRLKFDADNMTALLTLHSRLLKYPLFRVAEGTGLPLVSSNQRLCHPKYQQACEK